MMLTRCFSLFQGHLLVLLVGTSTDFLFLELRQNEVFYRETVLWNCLSQAVTKATSLSSFKKLTYI